MPSQSFARAGATVALAGVTASVVGYVFQVVMARSLGAAAFAELAVMLALTAVVERAYSAASLATTRQTAAAGADDAHLARRAFLWTLGVSVVVAAIAFALHPFLARVLNVSPIVALSLPLGIIVTGLYAVPYGFAHGQRKYGLISLATAGGSVVRLGGGLLAVALGLGVAGAAFANLLRPAIMALVVAPVIVLWARMARATERSLVPFLGDTSALGAAAFLSAAAATLDIVLAKLYLTAEAAGHYSAASVLGKVPLILATAVATVAFPVAATAQDQEDAAALRRRGLLLTLAIGVALVAVFATMGSSIFALAFGPGFEPGVVDAVPLAIAGTALALLHILTFVGLAQGRVTVLAGPVVALLAEAGLVTAFHADGSAIAWATASAASAGSVIVLAITKRHGSRGSA